LVTLREALKCARLSLSSQNIEDASLESELLLRHTLKISRAQLYSSLNRRLTPREEEAFWTLINRRLNNEPAAYITNSREFYGLDFYVDQRALIPRPESELLVEAALNLAKNHQPLAIADIGTGCGAIAISLAVNLPQARVYATDISKPALEVARINSQRHGVSRRIEFLQGNLLEPLPEPPDLVTANLPYVTKQELAQAKQLSPEPQVALDGGEDGLDKIRELASQLEGKLSPSGSLLLEIGTGQAAAVTSLFKNLFPEAKIEVLPDLSGTDRVVKLAL